MHVFVYIPAAIILLMHSQIRSLLPLASHIWLQCVPLTVRVRGGLFIVYWIHCCAVVCILSGVFRLQILYLYPVSCVRNNKTFKCFSLWPKTFGGTYRKTKRNISAISLFTAKWPLLVFLQPLPLTGVPCPMHHQFLFAGCRTVPQDDKIKSCCNVHRINSVMEK